MYYETVGVPVSVQFRWVFFSRWIFRLLKLDVKIRLYHLVSCVDLPSRWTFCLENHVTEYILSC